MKTALSWLLRGSVTFGIIGYLLWQSDLNKLGDYLKEAKSGYLIGALLCIGINIVMTALRWRVLMQVADLRYSIPRTTAITFIGYFFNAFLPGSTGGDVAKAYYLIRDDKSKLTAAISSIAADRMTGLITLLCLGSLAMLVGAKFLEALSEDSNIITVLQVMIVCVALILFTVFFFPFGNLPRSIKDLWRSLPFHDWIEKFYHSFRAYRFRWKLSLLAVGISFSSQLMFVFSVFLISLSLGLDVSFLQMMIIVPIVACAMGLPISFSGHGVREYMFVLLFTSFGIVPDNEQGNAAALAVSLLFMTSIFLWNLFGGLVFLFNKRKQPSPELASNTQEDA